MLRKNKKCFPNRGTTWDKPKAFPNSGASLAPTVCWLIQQIVTLATRQQPFLFSKQCQIKNQKNNEDKLYFKTLYQGKP